MKPSGLNMYGNINPVFFPSFVVLHLSVFGKSSIYEAHLTPCVQTLWDWPENSVFIENGYTLSLLKLTFLACN